MNNNNNNCIRRQRELMNCLREFGKTMPNTDCDDSDWSATANVKGRLNSALTVYYKPSVVHNILLASHFQTKCFWCLQDLTKVSRHPSSSSDRCDQVIADTLEADDAAQRVKKKYSVSKRSRPPQTRCCSGSGHARCCLRITLWRRLSFRTKLRRILLSWK